MNMGISGGPSCTREPWGSLRRRISFPRRTLLLASPKADILSACRLPHIVFSTEEGRGLLEWKHEGRMLSNTFSPRLPMIESFSLHQRVGSFKQLPMRFRVPQE